MANLKSLKPHIGIFGKRNVGKSSFINAISNQDIAIVSDYAGTTTDPVNKTMELAEVGPVILIDTAGVDDEGEIGQKRIEATQKTIPKIDIGIVIISENSFDEHEQGVIKLLDKKNTPFIIIHNKSDVEPLSKELKEHLAEKTTADDILEFSTIERTNVREIIASVKKNLPTSSYNNPSILGDLVSYGDVVVLVTPIDIEAPKGRIILPQVQTIRDALDNECMVVMMKERELDIFFKKYNMKPKLVITDSQIFLKASASIPKGIPLTSFSILFARMKGDFNMFIEGTRQISTLKENDNILILESCSHHVTGDDIGRVKIPRWLSNFTGLTLNYDIVAGFNQAPKDINEYSLIVQCGGCMLTRKQLINRVKPGVDNVIPITNYGMTIAYCHGIFEQAIEPFMQTGKEQERHLDYL
ncbi:MAG: [FeFe] hydrogenase H-cluster maturation GTPase HydF [Fibrobacterales bacterium]